MFNGSSVYLLSFVTKVPVTVVTAIPGLTSCGWRLLVFEEKGKTEHPEKNLLEQGREPTTNLTHIWRRVRESNTGHVDGKRVLSPQRPALPIFHKGFPAPAQIGVYS